MLRKHSTQSEELLINFLKQLGGTKLENYVSPGLSSTLLSEGKFRIFENTRKQEYFITPHSHRYDLLSIVLKGVVTNTIYKHHSIPEKYLGIQKLEKYAISSIKPKGEFGKYEEKFQYVSTFARCTNRYGVGDAYHMRDDEIHTINFSEDAVVLLIESPEKTDTSLILQPVNEREEVIPTMKVEPWMFYNPDL